MTIYCDEKKKERQADQRAKTSRRDRSIIGPDVFCSAILNAVAIIYLYSFAGRILFGHIFVLCPRSLICIADAARSLFIFTPDVID